MVDVPSGILVTAAGSEGPERPHPRRELATGALSTYCVLRTPYRVCFAAQNSRRIRSRQNDAVLSSVPSVSRMPSAAKGPLPPKAKKSPSRRRAMFRCAAGETGGITRCLVPPAIELIRTPLQARIGRQLVQTVLISSGTPKTTS